METAHPPPSPSYEFTPDENRTIRATAKWTGFWAGISLVSGLLTGFGALLGAEDPISRLVTGAVYVVVGLYFLGAARSLWSVVETRGDDVPHLIGALEKLTAAFKVMGVLVAVAVLVSLFIVLTGGPRLTIR